MRKLIPLLEIVLEVFKDNRPEGLDQYLRNVGWMNALSSKFRWNGLCQVVGFLSHAKVITKDEYYLLTDYLDKCEPKRKYQYGAYWWKPKEYAPRIAWLEAQIELLNSQ